MKTTSAAARREIFISYSHFDEDWKDRLVSHLRVLDLKEDSLDIWDDRRIAAGDDWRTKINDAVDRARLAVFLVSVDSLTSKFILEQEVPRFLKRRGTDLRVVWLYVSPCAWKEVPWLQEIQGWPQSGKALREMRRHQAENALADFAVEIGRLLRSEHPEGERVNGLQPESYDADREITESSRKRGWNRNYGRSSGKPPMCRVDSAMDHLRSLLPRAESGEVQALQDLKFGVRETWILIGEVYGNGRDGGRRREELEGMLVKVIASSEAFGEKSGASQLLNKRDDEIQPIQNLLEELTWGKFSGRAPQDRLRRSMDQLRSLLGRAESGNSEERGEFRELAEELADSTTFPLIDDVYGSSRGGDLLREEIADMFVRLDETSFCRVGGQGMIDFYVANRLVASDRSRLERGLRQLCDSKGGDFCQLMVWVDAALVPRSLPMSDEQMRAQIAQYNRNRTTGYDRFVVLRDGKIIEEST